MTDNQTSHNLTELRQQRIAQLKANMEQRIHILDGGMGTLIQSHQLEEIESGFPYHRPVYGCVP